MAICATDDLAPKVPKSCQRIWRMTSARRCVVASKLSFLIIPVMILLFAGLKSLADGTFSGVQPSDGVIGQWEATSLVGAPPYGYANTAIWTGKEMIVWAGGFSNEGRRI